MDETQATDLLEETWRSTISVGRDLTEAEWARPTDCPGWTVKDHVSHLIGTERLLQGLPRFEVDPGTRPYVRNPIGELNEREVEARRHLSGAEVLAEFEELVNVRLATLRGGDAAYFAQPAATPTGPGTVLDFLDIRVLDFFVHEQDIRRAIGRPGHLGGGPAEHTITRLIRTLPIVVGKRAAAPEGSTSVIAIEGPVERTVPIVVEAGRANVVDQVPAEPAVTVRMDTETFLVLAVGREEATARSAQIKIEGDQALGQAIVGHLNMMI
jgi:uncharacterized protein (TIGR03083 family)